MEKVRKSNFELLRIVCMLFIVGEHWCWKHHVEFDVRDVGWITDLGLRSFFIVAVNVFILISGYFSIKFKGARLARLVIQTLFYTYVIMALTMIAGWHTFDLGQDIVRFLPVLSKQYWFVTCYVILYIIAPYLNRWAESLSRSQYHRILIFGLAVVYIWPTFSYLLFTGQFIGDAGYGIINLSYLYMLGRYLRLHYKDTHHAGFYFGGYALLCVSLWAVQYMLSYVLGFEFMSWFSYNTVFVLAASVLLFLAFSHLTLYSRVINALAVPCLSVYLIHCHPLFWGDFCAKMHISDIHGWQWLLMVLAGSVLIYLVCFVIDNVRALLLGKLENWLVDHIIIRWRINKWLPVG